MDDPMYYDTKWVEDVVDVFLVFFKIMNVHSLLIVRGFSSVAILRVHLGKNGSPICHIPNGASSGCRARYGHQVEIN